MSKDLSAVIGITGIFLGGMSITTFGKEMPFDKTYNNSLAAFTENAAQIDVPSVSLRQAAGQQAAGRDSEILGESPANGPEHMPESASLMINGNINGDSLACMVEEGNLACQITDAQSRAMLQLADAVYLARITRTWLRTYDLREACPSSPQYTCVGGKKYQCTHTIVPVKKCEWRQCYGPGGTPAGCPNGQAQMEFCWYVDGCNVSCSPTGDDCKAENES